MLSALCGQSTIKGPKRRKLAVISSGKRGGKRLELKLKYIELKDNLKSTDFRYLYPITKHPATLKVQRLVAMFTS